MCAHGLAMAVNVHCESHAERGVLCLQPSVLCSAGSQWIWPCKYAL